MAWGQEGIVMSQQEIETEVRKRRDNGYDLHDSVLRVEIYLEQLTVSFNKLTGENGRCAKRGKEISSFKRIIYIATGGLGVLIFLIKTGTITL